MRRLFPYALLTIVAVSTITWMLILGIAAAVRAACRTTASAITRSQLLARQAREGRVARKAVAVTLSLATASAIAGVTHAFRHTEGKTPGGLSAALDASKQLPATQQAVAPATGRMPLHPIDVVRVAVKAITAYYPVRAGETLSSIAAATLGGAAHWPALWWANRDLVSNPNMLTVGTRLVIPASAEVTPAMVQAALGAIPKPPPPPAVTASAPQPAPQAAATSYTGSTSMQECIISRESGGNPDIWNASGHWGLYQFSESTWEAHGGPASEFGNASVAEQNQVFWNTVAADGYSDWAPYDGC